MINIINEEILNNFLIFYIINLYYIYFNILMISYDIYKSDKYKILFCIISKVGCSSIMESILYYDFNCPKHNIKVFKTKDYEYNKQYIQINFTRTIDISNFAKYKKVLFIRNSFDRFISYINNIWKENEYNNIFDKTTSKNEFINNVLFLYPKYKNIDNHAAPQSIFIHKFINLFNDKLKIYDISNLSNIYKLLTGNELILNNITNDT